MKILIVDDDSFSGELAAAILESEGHDCQCVEGGITALEVLAESPGFELVVSDMNMPLLSGLELYSELRGLGNQTPFILLTGDDPEPLRTQAPGLADCLMKNASLEQSLPAAVARL
jgi:CheY-like chemotaxis protein